MTQIRDFHSPRCVAVSHWVRLSKILPKRHIWAHVTPLCKIIKYCKKKKKKNKPCSLALIISISPRGIPKLKTPNTWVIQILNQSIFKKEILNHFFPHIHTHCASRFTGLVFVVGFFFVLFSFIFWKCPLALKNFPFFQVVDLIAHNAARCLFSPTFRCVYAYYYGPNHLLLLL